MRKPKLTLEEEIEGLHPDDPKLQLIVEKHRKKQEEITRYNKEQDYRRRMAIRIMELLGPCKSLSVSKLIIHDVKKLERIGKAAKALAEAFYEK